MRHVVLVVSVTVVVVTGVAFAALTKHQTPDTFAAPAYAPVRSSATVHLDLPSTPKPSPTPKPAPLAKGATPPATPRNAKPFDALATHGPGFEMAPSGRMTATFDREISQDGDYSWQAKVWY